MKSFNRDGYANQARGQTNLLSSFMLILLTLSFTTGISADELIVNGGFEEPNVVLLPNSIRGPAKGWTTFYGENKADLCTSYQNPANPFNPYKPSTFGFFDPVSNWEFECNDDLLIPGWEVYWTDTLLTQLPSGELVLNPDPDEPGRIELQHNDLPLRVNPNLILIGKRPVSFARFGQQKAELDSNDRVNLANGKPAADTNVTMMQNIATCANQAYVFKYSWRSRTEVFGDNDVRVTVGNNVVRTNTTTSDWVEETINFVADDSGSTLISFFSIGTGSQKGMSLDGVSVTGPGRDVLGNCPPPPSCEDDDSSDDGSSDDDSSDDLSCPAPPDDGSSDDGSSDDGSSDDGSSDDGSSDDGSSDDGSSDDGSSDDGSSDDDSSDDNNCGLCDDKPKFLTLVYDGDNDTSHGQDAQKVLITPETVPGGFPVEAYIVASDKHGNVIGSAGVKAKGESFDIPMQGSQVTLEIIDAVSGDVLQTVTFHISCSEPLNEGDSFGAITVWGGHD